MSIRHQHAGVVAAIVLATAAVFGPALVTQQIFTIRDHTDYFQPMRLFTAAHLRAGRLPLWNPYSASGEPWLANPQTGVFYPPAWLFVVMPFATAYVLYLALHAMVLGTGAYLLLRRWQSRAASAAAAVAVMMSGPVLSLLDVSNNYTTFAWVPLILWRAFRDRGRPGDAAVTPADHGRAISGEASPRIAAVLLAAAFLAGEPFFAAVAALAYAAIVRRWLTVVRAGAGAAALVAVQAIPFVELLMASDRVGGFRAADVLRDSFAPREWGRLLLPPRLASSIASPAEQFIAVPYAGVLVVLLAVIGAVSLFRCRAVPRAVGWLALLAGTLLLAAGPSWIASLPLTLFRYPARLLPFAVLALTALAAAGWDATRGPLLRGSSRPFLIADAVLVIAIVADLLVAARPLLVTARRTTAVVPYSRGIGRDGKIIRLTDPSLFSGRGTRTGWIAGYLNLTDRRFDSWTAAPAVSRAYSTLYDRARNDLGLLRQMAVTYVLSQKPMIAPFVPLVREGDVFVSRVPSALPLAYVRTAGGLQSPRFFAVEPSRVNVSVATAKGGTLVLTQNDAPGWTVSIDGIAARGKRALGTFRCVEVPPGSHVVTWHYRPLSLRIGAALSALGLLWLVAGGFRRRDIFRRAQ